LILIIDLLNSVKRQNKKCLQKWVIDTIFFSSKSDFLIHCVH